MYIAFSSGASEMLPSGAYSQIGVLPSEYRPINQYNLSDPSTAVNIQIEVGGSIKAFNYTSTKPSCYIIIPYF